MEAVLKTSREIDRTVTRIGSIVDALRAFARQGEEDPLRAELVEPIVLDTVELCAHRFRQRQIELAVDPIPEGVQAHCRGAQISQVLLNLLSNAYDAVENRVRRRVRITVEAANGEVQIAVVDSGPGIRPTYRHGSWSRSSRPRRLAAAPVLASRFPRGSPRRTAADWSSTPIHPKPASSSR